MSDLLHDQITPFWEAAKTSRLLAPMCDACGHAWWPPSRICPECLSNSISWKSIQGHGTIWSFVTYHRAYRKDLAPYVPYTVALVEFDNGIRLLSHIVDCPVDDIRIGQPVELLFRPIFGETDPVPVFRPIASG